MIRPLSVPLTLLAACACWPLSAVAQNPTPAGAEAVVVKGTLEEVSDQAVRVKVSDTEIWLVQIKPGETKVEVNGTAEAAYLHTGMTIRFEGEIDKKGNLQADISEAEIFTPQGKNALGLFSDKSEAAKAIVNAPAGKYDIRAKITKLKEHDITLLAGPKKTLFGTLPAEAEIKLASDDLSYAHQGDAVSLTGWCLPPDKATAERPGQAVADELTVTLAKPLVGTKKAAKAKPAKTPKAAREAREAKEAGEEGTGVTVQDPFGVDAKQAK